MQLILKVVSKHNPRNPSEAPKYYASHKSSWVIRENEILEEVASKTGATPQLCAEILHSLSKHCFAKTGGRVFGENKDTGLL